MSNDSGTLRAGVARGRTAWWIGAGLLALGVAMRINNAIRFRTGNGFDAVENVEYIRILMGSWALPAPDAAWATSHPPLFYYVSAALWRGLAWVGLDGALLEVLPLVASVAGLGATAAAVVLVGRLAPGDSHRAVLAGALLLFLPVHVYMAAMVGEELLVTLWMSLALLAASAPMTGNDRSRAGERGLASAARVGLFGGLAVLTKMSGALVVAAIGATWLVAGWRTGRVGPALVRCAVMGAVVLAVGGWFYVHNLVTWGYLYPQDLAVHAKMFEMPPGTRGVVDYLRVPAATFTNPQLLDPGLLRSVWGGTYDTIWFDGHRHFLARSVAVTRMGVAITLLGLLPTAAFGAGIARGARRALAQPGGIDTLLLAATGALLVGYVAFTWGNPWYVTVKGSYLLGLSVPFAVYASESLAIWTRRGGAGAWAIWAALALLGLLIVVTFTIGPVFEKLDGPGLPWREALG